MTKNRFLFTTKTIETLPVPASKRSTRIFYYDTKTRGLGLYVTSTGVKTFFVYRRVHGKPERIILGRFNEIGLDGARAKAEIVNSQIAEGHNPQEKKRAVRQDMTFGELWAMYLERHAKLCRSSWKNDANLHRLYLQGWSEKKLSYITSQTIRDLHQHIGRDNGMTTANHVHSLIRLMFNKAIEWGWNNRQQATELSEFRSNIGLGAVGVPFVVTTPMINACIAAARAIGLRTAGVDVIVDDQGNPYVLEVNDSPSLSYFSFDVSLAYAYDVTDCFRGYTGVMSRVIYSILLLDRTNTNYAAFAAWVLRRLVYKYVRIKRWLYERRHPAH